MYQKASNTNDLRGIELEFWKIYFYFINLGVYNQYPRNKKSKFKHVKIGSKRYYFYRIEWVDITGDAGHASAEEFDKFECSKMITHAYIYKKTSKFVWSFSSYEEKDVSFSDRNIFPVGCIVKMTKLLV